jgi:hypothetical protein
LSTPNWRRDRAAKLNPLPSRRLPAAGKMLRIGGGASEGRANEGGEPAAQPHVERSYHACVYPPRSPPPSQELAFHKS